MNLFESLYRLMFSATAIAKPAGTGRNRMRHARLPRRGRKCNTCHSKLSARERALVKITRVRKCYACRGLDEGTEVAKGAAAEKRHENVLAKRKDLHLAAMTNHPATGA